MAADPEPFSDFMRRVWQVDVAPLLRERRSQARRRSARTLGKAAAAGGLALDTVFGLKGRPFARFMTVVGASLGAMLPDAWDWEWLRSRASEDERRIVDERVQCCAEALPDLEALQLLNLTPQATLEEVRSAWRAAAGRWHPDRAATDAQKREFHLRFIALSRAHERIQAAFAAGRLPRSVG